jgi:hypothetical protein
MQIRIYKMYIKVLGNILMFFYSQNTQGLAIIFMCKY